EHSARHAEAARRYQAARVLHELQPQPAGEPVAGRYWERREIPQGHRIHHLPAARPVFLLDRHHRTYCKIKVREDVEFQRVLAINMRALSIALLFTSTVLPSFAQKFGAAENLAPYIPTPEAIVLRMLEAGHVKSED